MKQDSAPDTISASSLPWQNPLIQQLVNLRNQKQLPHAIIIELDTVTDSSAFGWQLVKSLLCLTPTENNLPCNDCSHCQLMKSNNFVDFIYLTLVENDKTNKLYRDIKIDQVRRLIHQLSLTPDQSRGKFALIYPAEKMNQSASNSLLKTLEEPAENTMLILLTHHAARLPITIRSRCQLWHLANPDTDVAVQWLTEQGMEKADVEEYLNTSGNDPQLAVQLLKQNYVAHLQQFKQQLKQFFKNEMDVIQLIQAFKKTEPSIQQLIIKNTLQAIIKIQLDKPMTQPLKNRLKGLLDLNQHSQWVLHTEENNLNLQLQLEDVLISLKQLITIEQ